MSFKIFIFGILFWPSCIALKGPNSSWVELAKAREVSCQGWPLPSQDLGLFDIKLFPSPGQGLNFVVETKDRQGNQRFYSAVMAHEASLEAEMLGQGLSLPAASQWAGAAGGYWAMIEPAPYLEAEKEEARTEDSSELHAMRLAFYQGATAKAKDYYPLSTDLEQLQLQEGEGGAWLIFQEEQRFRLKFLALPSTTKTRQEVLISESFASEPYPMGNPLTGAKAYALTFADSQSQASQGQPNAATQEDSLAPTAVLKLHKLGQGGKVERVFTLPLLARSGLEDWAVLSTAEGFYVAYLEGDSLVGEASLQLAAFRWQAEAADLVWQQSYPLTTLHVGSLVWVRGAGQEPQLLFLKWLDSEATLAAVQLSQSGPLVQEGQGVFPKGSSLLGAWHSHQANRTYALIRYRQGWSWQFDWCALAKS